MYLNAITLLNRKIKFHLYIMEFQKQPNSFIMSKTKTRTRLKQVICTFRMVQHLDYIQISTLFKSYENGITANTSKTLMSNIKFGKKIVYIYILNLCYFYHNQNLKNIFQILHFINSEFIKMYLNAINILNRKYISKLYIMEFQKQ